MCAARSRTLLPARSRSGEPPRSKAPHPGVMAERLNSRPRFGGLVTGRRPFVTRWSEAEATGALSSGGFSFAAFDVGRPDLLTRRSVQCLQESVAKTPTAIVLDPETLQVVPHRSQLAVLPSLAVKTLRNDVPDVATRVDDDRTTAGHVIERAVFRHGGTLCDLTDQLESDAAVGCHAPRCSDRLHDGRRNLNHVLRQASPRRYEWQTRGPFHHP